jgi:hypothetical protein
MTVTYNGSNITTDTLYEDGTIQVKKGFVSNIDSAQPALNVATINSAKTKNKVNNFTNETELSKPIVNLSSITSANQKEKIKIILKVYLEKNLYL